MTNTKTEYKYIEFNENNVPIIAGTRMKIIELVTSVKAYGWSPEELSFQYPHLTMGQIYSALAYYSDYRAEIDAEIETRYQEAEQQRIQAGESPFAARIRSRGVSRNAPTGCVATIPEERTALTLVLSENTNKHL